MSRTLWILIIALVAVSAFWWWVERDPVVPEGGATPEELLQRLTYAVTAKDYAELIQCALPEQRVELAFGLGVAGPQGSAMMREALLPAAAAAGPGEATRIKAEIARMRDSHGRVLKKHGIPVVDMEEVMKAGSDRAARAEMAKAALEGVDLVVLLRDVKKVMDEFPDGTPTARGPFGDANFANMVVKESGDTATAAIPSSAKTLHLKRIDGVWLADLAGM